MAGQVAFGRGNLLANRGDLQAAVTSFAEALRLAEASGTVVQAAMAHNNLAYHTLLTGDVVQVQRHIDAAAELTERYALSWTPVFIMTNGRSTGCIVACVRNKIISVSAIPKCYVVFPARCMTGILVLLFSPLLVF